MDLISDLDVVDRLLRLVAKSVFETLPSAELWR